ncbi:MAG TPA: thioesterase family protein [Dehalococcoidia bacterium]|nr:thioesterase family protein [Dehalococcoidia bacterium]
MPFSVRFPTRHTDCYAATGFVHAGVLLALTELAYAAGELAAGISKPAHIVAVEVRTRAEYLRPLPWQDGAIVEVTTPAAQAEGFTQTFTLRSARTERTIARIEHDWVWLDTQSGRAVPLDEQTCTRLLSLNELSGEPA